MRICKIRVCVRAHTNGPDVPQVVRRGDAEAGGNGAALQRGLGNDPAALFSGLHDTLTEEQVRGDRPERPDRAQGAARAAPGRAEELQRGVRAPGAPRHEHRSRGPAQKLFDGYVDALFT